MGKSGKTGAKAWKTSDAIRWKEIGIRPQFLSNRILSRQQGFLLGQEAKKQNRLLQQLALAREETVAKIRTSLFDTLSLSEAAEPFPKGWLSYSGVRRVNDELLHRISARSHLPPTWVQPGDWRSLYEGRYYCFMGSIAVRKNGGYSTTLACDDLHNIFTRRESMAYTITDAVTYVQDQLEVALGMNCFYELPSSSPTSLKDIKGILDRKDDKRKRKNREKGFDNFIAREDSIMLFVPVHFFKYPELSSLEQEKWEAQYAAAQVPEGPFPLPPVDDLVTYMLKSKVKAFVVSLDVRAEHDPHHWKVLKDFARPRYDLTNCIEDDS